MFVTVGSGISGRRAGHGADAAPDNTCPRLGRGLRQSSYTLTSGTFGTEPRGGDEPPSPFGPEGGLRRGLRRLGFASGIFSGFGVTGPSRYSKPSLSAPASSF